MKRNEVSATGIAFHDAGAGPPVLLLHAFGADATMWQAQVDVLVEAGYRVLAPDHRGFGQSPSPVAGSNFRQVVDDMVSVLDAAEVGAVVAAGVSMGSAASVALAVAHPGRVAGLLLADNSRPDGPERGHRAAERIRTIGMAALADVYEPILFGEDYRRSGDRYLADWRARLIERDPEDLATVVEPYHARPDPGPRLPLIDVPTAVVFGAEDAAVPDHRRDEYLAIPGSELFLIEGAGHMSNVEAPAAFNAILLSLAEKALRRRGSG